MSAHRDSPRVPQVLVERLALGELSPGQATEVRQRLVAAGELHRLEALQAEDDAILSDYPPRIQAVAIAEREGGAGARGRRRRLALWGLELAVVAAVLVAVVRPSLLPPGATGIHPDLAGSVGTQADELAAAGVRIKGEADLLVHRLGEAGPELLADGAPVAAGDTVQLQVQPGSYVGGHALVVSVDGRGSLTRHYTGPLPEGGALALPRAFRLDDAPEFERFVLVLSPEGPVDPGVIDEIRTLGSPASAPYLTHTLVKEGTP